MRWPFLQRGEQAGPGIDGLDIETGFGGIGN
jgi:hypothetical protein